MAPVERVVLIVIDSVGIGAMPDAAEWGDAGSNTLGNIARRRGGLPLPNMGRLGLGNLTEIAGTPPADQPAGAYGRMAIASHGKDTMTGHWEMVGIRPEAPFRTYPDGFPEDLIAEFCRRAGVPGVLGNKVASGTEIIKELGEEHLRTGWPIVYTSADSVFQVAAHEERFGLERLYRVCEVARDLLRPPHRVGRVIARPFVGTDRTNFTRTANRHDYALEPPRMILDEIRDAGLAVLAVGKIGDIFSGHGITWGEHTKSNADGIRVIHECLDRKEPGLIFANLVDFDMLYGHRRDVEGYAQALLEFDAALPGIMAKLGPRDVLVVTADHGNDPTHTGTDHTREYVPVLLCGEPVRSGVNVGTRSSLADLGATVADLLGVPGTGYGKSFAEEILK
ncbi:phosphopentomutase [Symbiobacterium terraclitae]|uniref:phosphopentomutase n=1 Tax=Symbiobacterium terraclitae TaxID=557451 RepID=UPI0035B51625